MEKCRWSVHLRETVYEFYNLKAFFVDYRYCVTFDAIILRQPRKVKVDVNDHNLKGRCSPRCCCRPCAELSGTNVIDYDWGVDETCVSPFLFFIEARLLPGKVNKVFLASLAPPSPQKLMSILIAASLSHSSHHINCIQVNYQPRRTLVESFVRERKILCLAESLSYSADGRGCLLKVAKECESPSEHNFFHSLAWSARRPPLPDIPKQDKLRIM